MKLPEPAGDYLIALSIMKSGFIGSQIAENMDTESRSLMMVRILELEGLLIRRVQEDEQSFSDCLPAPIE